MTATNARGVARHDSESAVAALVVSKWLRLAAAPTFTIMALLAVVLDGGAANGLCSAMGSFWLGGMAPMYLLMGVFHLAPWLNLISRRRNVAQHC